MVDEDGRPNNGAGPELKKNKNRIINWNMPPAICIASGTAISYYLLYNIFFTYNRFLPALFFFILIFLISVLRVIAFGNFFYSEKDIQVLAKKINLSLISFSIGLVLGLPARTLLPAGPDIPLPAGQVTGLQGILGDDPRAFNDGRGTGSLKINSAAGAGGLRVSAGGNVTVFFPAETIPGLKEFGRGAEIFIEGIFITGGRGTTFRASRVYVLNPASASEQFRTGFRSGVLEKFGILQNAAAPAWAGLASAMLLGIRDNLDSDMAASFRNAGCSHVLSLSGLNLAILTGFMAFFLKRLLGLRAASLAGAVFIIVYVFLAGAQPSLVRSAIIYLLGTLSLWGFLNKNPLTLLALAFILQLYIQGESGITVSFILSYTALAGILVTGNSVNELLRGKIPDFILTGLSASIGAFIMTAGVTVYYFGELHPVGLLAAILVMPLASLFMLVSFISLILISIIPAIFVIPDFILTVIYRFLELLVSLAGKAPGIETKSYIPVVIISLSLAASVEILKLLKRRGRVIESFET